MNTKKIPRQEFETGDVIRFRSEENRGDAPRVVTGMALRTYDKVVENKETKKKEHTSVLGWEYIVTPPGEPCKAKGAPFHKPNIMELVSKTPEKATPTKED